MTEPVILKINKNRVIAVAAIAAISLSDDQSTVFIQLNCGKEYVYTFSDAAQGKKAFEGLSDAFNEAGHASIYLNF